MKIRWLPDAERSLDDQVSYLATENPAAAVASGDAVHAAVERLSEFPLSARSGRVKGTRELVVLGTPLVVIYRVKSDAVTVLRVLHDKQRWPPKRRPSPR